MGKWLARLAALDDSSEEKNSTAPVSPRCQNRQNPVLAVLAGGREEIGAEISEARGAPAARPHPRGWSWSDADIARFHARRVRLLRWGWPADEAEALADRLTCGDVAGDDDRVSCADCRHHRPGHCGNHRRAGLLRPS